MTDIPVTGYRPTGLGLASFDVADRRDLVEPAAGTRMSDSEELPPVELPITGELDLHSFRPNELGDLVPHYLRLCQKRGLLEVRVVHGKGTGQVRASVHAILGRMPEVAAFSLATAPFGGHGATIVRLRPPESTTAVHRAGAGPNSAS